MIIELNEQNIQQTIVEGSQGKCVLIFAFDSEDPKTPTLTNTLTAKIGLDNQNITLAKGDLRTCPILGQILPIQALPSLIAVENGKIKDMAQGPEAENPDAFLAKILPQADEELYNQALTYFNDKNYTAAITKLDEAICINNKALYRITKADILIRQNKLPEANSIIQTMTMEDQLDVGDYYKSVTSAYALAEKAIADSPIEDLKQKVEQEPNNFDLRIELALQYNQLNQKTEALEQLYYILKKDINYKETKKTYLEIIETLGTDSNASKFRKKLYTLLY